MTRSFRGKTIQFNYNDGLNGVVEFVDLEKEAILFKVDAEDLKDFITEVLYAEVFAIARDYNPLKGFRLFRKRS